MKEQKQILVDESISVNVLLTEYITLHNKLLKNQGSILSILRNIFVRRIDFQESYIDLEILESKFARKRDRLIELAELNFEGRLNEYYNCLLEYTNALTNTVEILNKRQGALSNKSKGGKLTKKEFLLIQNEYMESIQIYTSIGARLNQLHVDLI